MTEIFDRTKRVVGASALEKLKGSRVLVFGVGGVGGHAITALARGGVGTIGIVDSDQVDITNINRQIVASHSTVGRLKTDVMEEMLKDINPDIKVVKYNMFYLPENGHMIDFKDYDYVVDCIDTVSGKLDIIERAKAIGIGIISSMGTGNKMEPTMLQVDDISKTSVCPLAKVIRKELRKRDIKGVKVVYSKEEPIVRANPPGSVSFVPSVAGTIMAGEVIKDLIGWYQKTVESEC